MERAPSLTPQAEVAPKDMSKMSSYPKAQQENMIKLYQKSVRTDLHNQYERQLVSYQQNFKGQNIQAQQVQGHTSPFDTALDRFSPNVAQHINF